MEELIGTTDCSVTRVDRLTGILYSAIRVGPNRMSAESACSPMKIFPNWDLSPNTPAISILVYRESDTLDHATTEAGPDYGGQDTQLNLGSLESWSGYRLDLGQGPPSHSTPPPKPFSHPYKKKIPHTHGARSALFPSNQTSAWIFPFSFRPNLRHVSDRWFFAGFLDAQTPSSPPSFLSTDLLSSGTKAIKIVSFLNSIKVVYLYSHEKGGVVREQGKIRVVWNLWREFVLETPGLTSSHSSASYSQNYPFSPLFSNRILDVLSSSWLAGLQYFLSQYLLGPCTNRDGWSKGRSISSAKDR
ncbi:unnamed protein product [Timema podura]|uniref:Uncharacterized protein n=1 Tax=Timema podura TaxID=61482 RepID=A0ABN7NUR9_TIMPD|nr:unnamed protein product [Timema podura]